MKWEKVSKSKAVAVEAEDRERMISDVTRFMERHPKEPWYSSATGDTLVIGVRSGKGKDEEITVYEAKIRQEFYTFPNDKKKSHKCNCELCEEGK